MLKSFFLLLAVSATSAQSMAQSFRTSTYSEVDGLPSSSVLNMCLDSSGKIWMLTRLGIVTFYQGEISNFTLPESYDDNKIHQMKIDARGGFWFALYGPDCLLYHMQDGKWSKIKPPPALNAQQPLFSIQLAVAETEYGPLVAYICNGLAFFYLDGQWSWTNDQEANFGKIRQIQGMGSSFLAATSKGVYAMNSFSAEALMPANSNPMDLDVQAIYGSGTSLEEHGPIYVLGTHWLGVLEKGAYRRLCPAPKGSAPNHSTLDLVFADEGGDLLLANSETLYNYMSDSGSLRQWTTRSGFAGSGASCLLQDREHGLWIGGTHGATRISNRQFDNYANSDGLPEIEVSALLYWPGKGLLVGQNQNLMLINGQKRSLIDMPIQIKSRIMEMKEEPDGGVLLGVLGVGIVKLDAQFQPTILKSEHSVILQSAQRDHEDTLWAIGTNGIFKFSNGMFRQEPSGELDLIQLRRIQSLRSGKLAISSFSRGLFIKDKVWKNYSSGNEMANSVYSVLETSNGNILVGTRAGLMTPVKGKLVRYDRAALTRPVYFIHEDPKQRIWVGTDSGIYRVGGGPTRHYTSSNGLPSMETNRSAVATDQNGSLWFGTTGGLSHFRENYDFDPIPPSIDLIKISSSDKYWATDQPVKLEAHQDNLTFHYRAFSMEDKDSLWVSYKLEPFDSDWRPRERANVSQAQYQKLPPGTYHFKIKSLGASGIWSPAVSSAQIELPKPLVQQTWFVLLMILLAVLLGFSIFDYLASKRFSSFLQMQVEERTAELTNKNQMLLEKIHEKVEAEAKIQALNEDLEKRVIERTMELEALQRDLVENAHYAGMAEIATSMLHNVGNILNSISTAGFLLQQTLEQSKVSSLHRANDLLRPKIDGFEDYLREDPKARDLLRFYLTLGDRIENEHNLLHDQILSLLERIDTIKDVVAQQHNYTSGVYQTETLSLDILLETSLKIMEASLGSREIKVVRHLNRVPAVNIQKTKMIHTMVNLLKNAAEAILMSDNQQREIILRSWSLDANVFLSVTDSGSGIPLENLSKIFNHGFTTKTSGNGFGLHSCANAIKEMGGMIWAQNRKDACGAVFTIRLPVPNYSESERTSLEADSRGTLA